MFYFKTTQNLIFILSHVQKIEFMLTLFWDKDIEFYLFNILRNFLEYIKEVKVEYIYIFKMSCSIVFVNYLILFLAVRGSHWCEGYSLAAGMAFSHRGGFVGAQRL